MASSVLFLTLFLAAAQSASLSERIVGGTTTTIEQYPFIVQVEFRIAILWSQSCAANIISTRYVVSAAHCFDGILGNSWSRRIRAGSTNRNSGGITVGVERVVNHPSYGRLDADGDINVVRLSSFLTFNDRIQNIPILAQGQQLPDNVPVVHAGWGATSQGGSASSLLRRVTIYTINRELCRQRYAPRPRSTITDNMICAGILNAGGRDACQGDSGGPLVYSGILVGVVSWGRGCADPFYPGVSTAVSSYTNWIQANAV